MFNATWQSCIKVKVQQKRVQQSETKKTLIGKKCNMKNAQREKNAT